MFNNWLVKNLFILIIIFSVSSYAQGKKITYIVELDTLISFKKFTLSNGYLNHSELINSINNPAEKR